MGEHEQQIQNWVEEQRPYDSIDVASPSCRWKQVARAFIKTPFAFALLNNALFGIETNCLNRTFVAAEAPSEYDVDRGLRISTLNIARGAFGMEDVAAALADQDADLQCLQEAPEESLPDLIEATGLPHKATNWNGENLLSRYGNVTLTKLKIIASEEYNLPSLPQHHQRSMLVTVVENKLGDHTAIFNAHLAAQNGLMPGQAGLTEREVQTEAILSILNSPQYNTMPVVLCVDLNERPNGSSYNMFSRHLHDTTLDINPPPNGLPTLPKYGVQSDYIWTNFDWISNELHIFGNGSSDHCGLKANVRPKPSVPSSAPIRPMHGPV